jgi:hypothetical protein
MTDAQAFPKIQAIKAVRQETDCGLKEAKGAVEEAMEQCKDYDAVVREAIMSISYEERFTNFEFLYKSLRRAVMAGLPDPVYVVREIEAAESERVNKELQKYRDILKMDIEDAIKKASRTLGREDINRVLLAAIK